MSRGKTVTLYLIDGLPNGKIRAKLSGWDGIAYKIPRRMLSDCEELDNFNNSGIYFLFGNGAVYIEELLTTKMINIRNCGMKLLFLQLKIIP